jgi:NAD(P)-dependent dehydrogenase (short-subunit alcohol dehydrogenase family)
MNSAYPMGRIGKAAEVAEAMLWLATKATWSTGQHVTMDGGSMTA